MIKPLKTTATCLSCLFLLSLGAASHGEDIYPLDDFDLASGEDPVGGRFDLWEPGVNRLFQNATGAATYLESEAFGISGNEQMTVSTAAGGYVFTPFRYISDNLEGPSADPFFNLLQTYPVIEFKVRNNGDASVGIQLSINTEDGFTYNVISSSNLPVAPGASATYQFELGNDATYHSLLEGWTSGRFDLRILQGTPGGTPSDVTYDDFKLRVAPEEGILEDYDTFLGFFDQFNPNAVYTIADINADGDKEMEIDISVGGFAMGLRKTFASSNRAADPLIQQLLVTPTFEFDYINRSSTDIVTIGVVLEQNVVPDEGSDPPTYSWIAFGSVDIEPGAAGHYAHDLMADPVFSQIVTEWLAGSGSTLRFRVLQQTGGGVPSVVAWDNFQLTEPLPQGPLVPGEWTLSDIGSVYGYSEVWGYSIFMGTVYMNNLPWIYHTHFGWIYLISAIPQVGGGTAFWMYNTSLGNIYVIDGYGGFFQWQKNSGWQLDNFLSPNG